MGQNQTIGFIQIVLRDDSPDDGIAGAAFFPAGSDVILTYRDGTVERGGDIGFAPVIEGGFDRPGFVAADGQEEIRLLYDFDGPEFAQNAHAVKDSIVQVEFELVLGNDYQVWATSNRQTNERGETVLLLIDQAEGNVQDVTNLRTVRFEYGLPTATHVAGVTLEVRGWRGFDFYGEYDRQLELPQVSEPLPRGALHVLRDRGRHLQPGVDGEPGEAGHTALLLRRGLFDGPRVQHGHLRHPGRRYDRLREPPRRPDRVRRRQRRPRPQP